MTQATKLCIEQLFSWDPIAIEQFKMATHIAIIAIVSAHNLLAGTLYTVLNDKIDLKRSESLK